LKLFSLTSFPLLEFLSFFFLSGVIVFQRFICLLL
jgi:hypothetical protein